MRSNIQRFLKVYSFCKTKLVPKKDYLPPESERGLMFNIFHKAKLSPAYPILSELFEYLQNSQKSGQFQLLQSSPKLLTNFMFLHLMLLKNRLEDTPISHNEFVYLLETYFYIPFAEKTQKSIPIKDFGRHFIDIYINKYNIYCSKIRDLQERTPSNLPLPKRIQQIQKTFKLIVYENKLRESDPQLMKLAKYYQAHRLYLNSLEWKELTNYVIRWGFFKTPEQLQ